MASTDKQSKSENLTSPADQQGSTAQSVPIYNAASSHQHSHECNDPSHHHYPSFLDQEDEHSSSAAAKFEKLAKRKAKKNQQQAGLRTELIPGHRGESDIDDLVNFINGPSTANNSTASKKSKKKASATATATAAASN